MPRCYDRPPAASCLVTEGERSTARITLTARAPAHSARAAWAELLTPDSVTSCAEGRDPSARLEQAAQNRLLIATWANQTGITMTATGLDRAMAKRGYRGVGHTWGARMGSSPPTPTRPRRPAVAACSGQT